MKNFFKKPWIIISLVVIVIIVIILIFSGGKKKGPETVKVVREKISEEVSATGNVKPVQSVDLAFEKSGRIAVINANVGDNVYIGEAIVILDKADLEAQKSKAEADLEVQKADLEKAKVDLANYFGSVSDVLNDAYVKANDAVRNQLDAIFINDESQNPSLSFSTNNIAIDNDARSLRFIMAATLNQWLKELNAIKSATSYEDLNGQLEKASGYLSTTRSLLLKAMDAVINASDSSLTSSSANTYKANINTGLTNINTAIANLTTRKQLIISEKTIITSLETSIKSYEASVNNIKAQISKMTIYAPIRGVITIQNAKVGEIAPAGSVIVSIISANNFEVEANVAEADIAKVKIGNTAQITLDAYGNDVNFDAKVFSVDPAETIIEGVATYKTKFQFAKSDNRIKSGMTANITIHTSEKENVLVLPQRTVGNDNGQRFVLIDLGNGKSEKRDVEVGLRGADGNIEIIKGLNENDVILVNYSQ
ncbi:MAG: efflux RND transporter periplasmic adaptor subunit [Patescibacteria group bacterium]